MSSRRRILTCLSLISSTVSGFITPLAPHCAISTSSSRAAGAVAPSFSCVRPPHQSIPFRMMSGAPLKATSSMQQSDVTGQNWKINLLFDSDCPLCMKEVDFLKKRDVEGNIKFTDLNDLDYNEYENGGVTFEDGMKVIHAILDNGEVVKGVEVFRRVYDQIGLGWVYAATKVPFVGWFADSAYDAWAVNRLKLTGRPDLSEVLKERAEKLKNKSYDDCEDECEIKW